MNPVSVEVFVEDTCKACDEVLEVIESLSTEYRFNLNVYDRHRHQSAFRYHSVVICPATFVSNKLAFYGSFSKEDISLYLQSQLLSNNKERIPSQ
jgi:thiol-disulfide isomerase/thioredoxin